MRIHPAPCYSPVIYIVPRYSSDALVVTLLTVIYAAAAGESAGASEQSGHCAVDYQVALQ